VRSARAVAVVSAGVLVMCFAVICGCGRTIPNVAVAAAYVSLPVLVVFLAAARRVFGPPPGQAAVRRVSGVADRHVRCPGHADGQLCACPVIPWQSPAGRGRS
jgi:hypothetical protein